MTQTIRILLMMMCAVISARGQVFTNVPAGETIWSSIPRAESYVLRAGYDAEGFWRVDYDDGNYLRTCGLLWSIGNGREICLSQWQMMANRALPSFTRALDSRPPIRRESGRELDADRTEPISVMNGSGGYPEITPGSYMVVSGP